jgi:hypothetical protein
MDFHFSEETLRKNLEVLVNRAAPSGCSGVASRASCAEARFEVDQTVLRMAYLAHLSQHSTD